MPVEDLEVVWRVRDAWCRFVPDEIARFYSTDAEIVSPSGEMFGGSYRGHEGLRRYIEAFVEVFDPPGFELDELLDAGHCVVEVVHVSTRGRKSGVEVRRRIPSIYTVRGGLITRQVIYLDPAEAFAAVALGTADERPGDDQGQTRARYRVHGGPDAQDVRPPDTKEISIRRARPRDAEALTATFAEAVDGYRVWAPAGWSPPDQTAEVTHALAQALSQPEVWCLLAESRQRPFGHVALSPRTTVQPKEAPAGTVNLWQLFVRPKWQGRGIGPLLMRAALAEARRRGFTRLRLWTPRDASRARRFYEREGFTLTGSEREESPLGIAIVEYTRGVSEGESDPRQ